jgi:uncharacterized membrane protein
MWNSHLLEIWYTGEQNKVLEFRVSHNIEFGVFGYFDKIEHTVLQWHQILRYA